MYTGIFSGAGSFLVAMYMKKRSGGSFLSSGDGKVTDDKGIDR